MNTQEHNFSEIDTGKRLVRGSILRTALLGLQLIISFIMMPVIIHALGDRMYGFWTLFAIFIGYYGLLDIGLSTSVVRYISRALGRNDIREVNDVVATSLFLYIIVGVVALLISLLIAIFCPYFTSNPTEIVLFRRVIVIMGISLAIGMPMRVFSGILISHLRYDLRTYITMLRVLISTALIYYFLKNGHGILAMTVIILLTSLVSYVLLMICAKKVFVQLKISCSFRQKDMIRQLFKYSGKTFIARIADIIKFKIDSFVVAGFLGLSSVTYYFVGARIVEYFMELMQRSVDIMMPVFSQYESRGDYDSIRKRFLGVIKISVIISVFTGASIIFYGKAFIQRWLGPGFDSSYYVAVILCVPFIVALMQVPTSGVLYGISKHHFFAVSNTCEGAINLVLSLILVRYYGIYGVALGTAIPMIIFKVLIQPFYVCRVISLSIYKYYVETLVLTMFKILAPLLAYFYIMKDFLKADYTNIALIGGIQMLFFVPMAFFFVMGREERGDILKAIRR